MHIVGAGILFTDGASVLTGFHPSRGAWSGFGGKCEDGEIAQTTAVREVCEEVFGLEPAVEVLEEIRAALQFEEPSVRGDYAMFIVCVDELFTIGNRLEKNGYTSPFYASFPKVISELLEQRSVPETAEIREILWFPLSELDAAQETFAPEFYKDLLEFKAMPSNA